MLLGFLQSQEVRPVGPTEAKRVDVRIIAARDRDLDVPCSTTGMGRRELARLVGLGRLRLIGPRRGVRHVPPSLCLWLPLPPSPTETPSPPAAMSCNLYHQGMARDLT